MILMEAGPWMSILPRLSVRSITLTSRPLACSPRCAAMAPPMLALTSTMYSPSLIL